MSARVLGVTATPDRADGKGLGKVFASVAYTFGMRDAIRQGHLAPLRARRVMVADLDLSAVRSHHGDFDQSELAAALIAEKALHGVVSPLLQLAGKRKTLVFAADVAHARALAEVINRHEPASAIALDGKASDAQRKAVISLFQQGAFRFLVNCALFTEGFDEPSIECVAMCRPTMSRGLYTQMLGRGTRKSEATGKTDCLVLDFVGNSAKHRLIGPADALAGYTLDDDARDLAEAKLDGQTELEDILVVVDGEVALRRTKMSLIAVTHYRTKEVDPFIGDFVPPLDPDSPSGRMPATDAQLAALESAGLGKSPSGLTKGEASQMLDGVAARRKAGLATIPMCRLLNKLGLDTRTMPFPRAQQLIGKCRKLGFRSYVVMHEPEFRRGGKS